MRKEVVVLLLLLGVALLIAAVWLRVKTDGRYEIKTTDLVFILVPLLLVALATGKLQGLDLFGVKADLSALWADAANTEVSTQLEDQAVSDAIDVLPMATKGGVGEIPGLIEQRTQILAFRLGMGGYYGPAINTYFDKLYGSSYLRFIVINNPDGTLFGFYPAADLIAYLRTRDDGYDEFTWRLNQDGADTRDWLAQLPSFVGAEQAVTTAMSKRDTLQRMAALDVDALPATTAEGRFAGVVERSKLTASMILTVTEKLNSQ